MHDRKVQAAREAINDLFSDTSVPQETTRESLETLQAEIEELLETLPEYLCPPPARPDSPKWPTVTRRSNPSPGAIDVRPSAPSPGWRRALHPGDS